MTVFRASLVAVLLLLTSVGAASAECAWVLWTRDRQGWEYKAPFETYDECKADIKRHRDEWTRSGASLSDLVVAETSSRWRTSCGWLGIVAGAAVFVATLAVPLDDAALLLTLVVMVRAGG